MNFCYACLAALTLFFPGLSLACAGGCGLFGVGTSAIYASHAGGMVFLEYDYVDQSHNWSGTSSAPADNNADEAIRSRFMSVGGQYQFDRSWGPDRRSALLASLLPDHR